LLSIKIVIYLSLCGNILISSLPSTSIDGEIVVGEVKRDERRSGIISFPSTLKDLNWSDVM
jgi:hypothetical protein